MAQVVSVLFEEATPEQARSYATKFLNLELGAEATDADIRAAIAAAEPGVSRIWVLEEPPAPPEPVIDRTPAPAAAFDEGFVKDVPLRPEEKPGRMAGSLGQGDPRAIIEIPVVDTDDDTGNAPVYVGVNGRGWQLARGVELNVPWRVVLALQDAVQNNIRHDQREGKEGEVISTMAKRIPFHFIEKPSQASIDAWHARVDAEFCA